jgi:hypothetical protein
MTEQQDTAMIAGQLADLTQAVEKMASQLVAMRERADTQQERIDLAARELAEVSTRLQAAPTRSGSPSRPPAARSRLVVREIGQARRYTAWLARCFWGDPA